MIEFYRPHPGKAARASGTNLSNTHVPLNELLRFSAAPNGLAGLSSGLFNLFASFAILSADRANIALRRNVVRGALKVATQLNAASARLAQVRKDLNRSIQSETERANQLLGRIAGINGQISAAPSVRLTAALKEQIHGLSEIVKMTATPQPDKTVKINIGGVNMIFGQSRPERLGLQQDKNGNWQLCGQRSGAPLKLAGGGLTRKITARDGGLAELQDGLDKLAVQLIARANPIYSAHCNPGSQIGQNLFCGTDASSISVNTRLNCGVPPRRRSPAGFKWYQQVCQDFDAMQARLEELRPMR